MAELTDKLATALAGRYRIERRLGEGGMATVYLAVDLKHERKVAVKVLRPELAAVLGAERFVQEIKTTASLQHPHILPLFDSGRASVPPPRSAERGTGGEATAATGQDFLFYVMPYVEGETLRDRLNRETQLSIEEAVRIATEVADALDYAHRNDVIHRDIKPENILLHDGRAMVADFGIALAVSAAAGGRMTETGMSLGTPHYMSPEQATADRDITSRSDIYSLGGVLYEMLTGDPPHTGSSAQAIIMKIVTDDVRPVTELRRSVPANVAAASQKALERLAADRFSTAAAFAEALANPSFRTQTVGPAGGALQTNPADNHRLIGMTALAAVAVVAAAWGWLRSSEPPPVRPVAFYLEPPEGGTAIYSTAFSPDGRRLVAEVDTDSGTVLFQRTLDNPAWAPIPGTLGTRDVAVSPGGESVAFMRGQLLQWMPLDGGSARTVIRYANVFGVAWGPDGTLIIGTGRVADSAGGLVQVPITGGTPHHLTTTAATETAHYEPSRIPGTDVVLFSTMSAEIEAFVTAVSITTGRTVRLGPGMTPQADSSGHVVYMTSQGSLVAQPFDPRKLEFVGQPREIANQVASFSGLFGMFGLGFDGSLVYAARRDAGDALLLLDRQGQMESEILASGPGLGFSHARFSPSGDRVAYVLNEGASDRGTLYVRSLRRETSQRLTFGGQVADPAWTPDGRYIGYSTVADDGTGLAELMLVAADGTGTPRRLLRGSASLWQLSFAPDAKTVLMRVETPENDIAMAVLGRDTMPVPLWETTTHEEHGTLSPDGRWMAYISSETGRDEVYVRAFPELGPKTQVSVNGGQSPAWPSDGTTLYYEGQSRIIEAVLKFEGNLATVTTRTPLFRSDWLRATANRSWDVAPDRQHFVVIGNRLRGMIWRVNALAEDDG